MNRNGEKKVISLARQELIKADYKPDDKISNIPKENREQYAKDMRYNVSSLNILYNNAKDVPINYSETISQGGNLLGGEYNSTYEFVGISSLAFKTNLSLFSTLIHEGLHAWDHQNGMFQAWGWNGRGNMPSYVRSLTEARAYGIQRWFNGGELKGLDLQLYNQYLSSAKNLKQWNNPQTNLTNFSNFISSLKK